MQALNNTTPGRTTELALSGAVLLLSGYNLYQVLRARGIGEPGRSSKDKKAIHEISDLTNIFIIPAVGIIRLLLDSKEFNTNALISTAATLLSYPLAQHAFINEQRSTVLTEMGHSARFSLSSSVAVTVGAATSFARNYFRL